MPSSFSTLNAIACAVAFVLSVLPQVPAQVPAPEPAPLPMHEVRTESLMAIDALMAEAMADGTFPGAVVLVGDASEIRWAAAYGRYTDAPDAPEVTLASIFDLASLSKVVGTLSAALVAWNDGALAPDDLVAQHITGFDQNGKAGVTIRDLMRHTSGLKAYESKDAVEASRPADTLPCDALIARYASLAPSYAPRTGFVYSCLNFQTLARITEESTGQRMADLLTARVFAPLGMIDATYELNAGQLSRTLPTIRQSDGTPLVGRVHDPLAAYHGTSPHTPGNAGLFATGPDVARFCQAVLREGRAEDGTQVFAPAILAEALSAQQPEGVTEMHGLGWDIYEAEGYTTPLNAAPGTYAVGHTGYTGTMIWIDLRAQVFFVFLSNRTWPDDRAQTDGKIRISDARRRLVGIVQRSCPEYATLFAEPPSQQL